MPSADSIHSFTPTTTPELRDVDLATGGIPACPPISDLGPDWVVLNAVPLAYRGSAIDHLLIGPAGVYTLDVRHHPDEDVLVLGDTFMVGSTDRGYVARSRFEARRAATLLSGKTRTDVDVHGLVLVTGRGGPVIVEQPADAKVTVLTDDELVGLLDALPPVLGRDEVERVYAVARHLATWQPKTVAWSDSI